MTSPRMAAAAKLAARVPLVVLAIGAFGASVRLPAQSVVPAAVSAADSLPLHRARADSAAVDSALPHLRVVTRDVARSGSDVARITAHLDGGIVRRVQVLFQGVTTRGTETFWFTGDTLRIASRRIDRYVVGTDSTIRSTVLVTHYYDGDRAIHLQQQRTGDARPAPPPDAHDLHLRGLRWRACVLAPASDEQTCIF